MRRCVMNFTAYIQRQKFLIRRRHEGECFLMQSGEEIPVSDRDRLLGELESMRGLNVEERTGLFRGFRRG